MLWVLWVGVNLLLPVLAKRPKPPLLEADVFRGGQEFPVSFIQEGLLKSSNEYAKSQPLYNENKKANDPAKKPKSQSSQPSPPAQDMGKKAGVAKRRQMKIDERKRREQQERREAELRRRKRGGAGSQATSEGYRYPINPADPRFDLFNRIIVDRNYDDGDFDFVDYKMPAEQGGLDLPEAPPPHTIVVSLNKPTAQSSTGAGGVSSRAVDGNNNPNYGAGHCTHNGQIEPAWWRVDLQDEYRVSAVSITNRGDCCSERLANFNVRVGNSTEDGYGKGNTLCSGSTQGKMGPGETRKIECDDAEGRYVSVSLTNSGVLTLCGVEVFAYPIPKITREPEDVSVQWGADIVMSATAEHAQQYQWFRGESELPDDTRVSGSRTPRLTVARSVFDDAGEDYYLVVTGKGGKRHTRKVTVFVMPGLIEIATFQSASQSSTEENAVASRAVDGYPDPLFPHGHCTMTQTESSPWWRVDLGKKFDVQYVRVLNRGDCCGGRLKDFYVGLSNHTSSKGILNGTQAAQNVTLCGGLHAAVPQGKVRQVSCAEAATTVARYVTIQLSNVDALTLCNVWVFGNPIPQPKLPKSCQEVFDSGETTSGFYQIAIAPDTRAYSMSKEYEPPEPEIMEVFCDMETYGGGWTMILRQNISSRVEANLFPPNGFDLNTHDAGANAYSIMSKLYSFRSSSATPIEYLVRWPSDDVEEQHWEQTNNVVEDEIGFAPLKYNPIHVTHEGWGGMMREPTGNAALVAFKNGNHLAYAGIYYYSSSSMPGCCEDTITSVVELYAREKFEVDEAASKKEEPMYAEPPTAPAPTGVTPEEFHTGWGGYGPADLDLDVEPAIAASEQSLPYKTPNFGAYRQGGDDMTHHTLVQTHLGRAVNSTTLGPSRLVKHDAGANTHGTYSSGLQDGLDDFWKTYQVGLKAGFTKGYTQGVNETVGKFQKAYTKAYSTNFYSARTMGQNQRQQDETTGKVESSQQNTVSSDTSTQSGSSGGTAGSSSSAGGSSGGGSGSGSSGGSGGNNDGSTGTASGSAKEQDSTASSVGMDDTDTYRTNADEEQAKDQEQQQHDAARDSAAEGGSPSKVDSSNVAATSYQLLLQSATNPRLAVARDRWASIATTPVQVAQMEEQDQLGGELDGVVRDDVEHEQWVDPVINLRTLA